MKYTLAKSYYIIDSTGGMDSGKVVSALVGDRHTEDMANLRADALAREHTGRSYDVVSCLTRRIVETPVVPPIVVYEFANG